MNEPIYIGDIVRLPAEHGALVGTLIGQVKDGNVRVQLSGAATIDLPPAGLTYAGPPIPPEPDVGTPIMIEDTAYRREDDGWHPMGKNPTGRIFGADELLAVFFTGDENGPPYKWERLLRLHGHATPHRILLEPLEPR